jgi:hypothetical protein
LSNYTKTTDFAIKDSLATGNAAKVIRGTEHDVEYNNIALAIATKADISGNVASATTASQVNTTTWHMYESGGYLYFTCSGVVKARLGPDGTFYHTGDGGGFVAL